MSVKDRCTDHIDTLSFAFLLKTHELRTFKVALEELKFRDQFVVRMYEIICDDPRKSTKARLGYLLTPELATTYTLRETKSKLGISNYKYYRTAQSVLYSWSRSATCPEKEIAHPIDVASHAFLHDARDEVNKRGWRPKEMVS
ncbi:unnamed protein product [Schistosoma curassoni]|uniref:Replication initiation protein n=1 Tax=Schistosoma curassoni TaxID=6186 RepID=A0A183JBR7_9TREM|nr:unnamed protein product [Schistosoma curassoni]